MKVQTEGMSQKQAESNASKNRSETCKDWYHWKMDLTVHDDEMYWHYLDMQKCWQKKIELVAWICINGLPDQNISIKM